MMVESSRKTFGFSRSRREPALSHGESSADSGAKRGTDGQCAWSCGFQIFGLAKPGLSARMVMRLITALSLLSDQRTEMISPGCNTPRLNRLPRPSSTTQVSRGRRLAFFGQGCLALFITLVFGVSTVQAQTAVCSNTPATGERIECVETADSTNNIDINVQDLTIETMDAGVFGIYGKHEGTSSIDIDMENTTIETMGDSAHGVLGWHVGAGDINIDVKDTTIETMGDSARGVLGFHTGAGDINIDVQGHHHRDDGR